MPPFRKGRKSSFKRAAVSRKSARKPRVSKALTKAVQSIIHKDVETKVSSVTLDLTAYNSSPNVSADITKIIPSVVQGTDNAMRIGDNIRGQSLTVRGHLLLAIQPNNSTINCRIAVRLFCVQPKRYSNDVDVVANPGAWLPYLLQNANNQQAFTGTIQDLYLPVNRESITVYYDKVHYLTIPYVQAIATGVGTGLTSTDLATTVKFFSMKIPMKNKLLKFQDANNTPLNFSPVVIMGYTKLDGTLPDTVSTNVSMSYVSTFKYEDA